MPCSVTCRSADSWNVTTSPRPNPRSANTSQASTPVGTMILTRVGPVTCSGAVSGPATNTSASSPPIMTTGSVRHHVRPAKTPELVKASANTTITSVLRNFAGRLQGRCHEIAYAIGPSNPSQPAARRYAVDCQPYRMEGPGLVTD